MANNKDAFFAWAFSVLPPARIKRLGENLTRVQKFAAASRLMAGSLFNVTNNNTLNNISQAILAVLKNKYILFPWSCNFNADIFDDFNAYRHYCNHVLEQEASKTNPPAPASTQLESAYNDFLVNGNFAETTRASYIRHIKKAENYAKENGYAHCSLFGESKEETIATVKELYKSKDFIALNKQEHMRFTSAINKLLECIGAKDIIKPIVLEKPLDKRFLAFLKKEKLAKQTCNNYIAHIIKAENYAKNNGYAHCSLFCESTEEIISTAQELYADADFITWNKKVHMTFSAAINRLLEFIGVKPITIDKSTLYKDSAAKVLEKHYAYGCRYDSLREMMRFRRFAQEMGLPLPPPIHTKIHTMQMIP